MCVCLRNVYVSKLYMCVCGWVIGRGKDVRLCLDLLDRICTCCDDVCRFLYVAVKRDETILCTTNILIDYWGKCVAHNDWLICAIARARESLRMSNESTLGQGHYKLSGAILRAVYISIYMLYGIGSASGSEARQ